jgi:hypothetical protein
LTFNVSIPDRFIVQTSGFEICSHICLLITFAFDAVFITNHLSKAEKFQSYSTNPISIFESSAKSAKSLPNVDITVVLLTSNHLLFNKSTIDLYLGVHCK